jgi:preprotein translocase subunit SecY
VSLGVGFSGGGGGSKGLSLSLTETIRLAWADPELRQRITFILIMFGVFAFGVHVPVPIPGVKSSDLENLLNNPMFAMLNMFGGGALRRLSIFALGLNPYITASIIMQILYTAVPKWKQEMQEGGEYARTQQNKKTRLLTIFLCFAQGYGLLSMMMAQGGPAFAVLTVSTRIITLIFWTAGAMFMLWLGEQISERGIGNGVSLMIFAGIILSLPQQAAQLQRGVHDGSIAWWSIIGVLAIFVGATWFVVFFTTAQRRIPIQHMRRVVGTKMMGGQTSYLPFSVNMAGVMPIIFAISLVGIPFQFSQMLGGQKTPVGNFLYELSTWLSPSSIRIERVLVACLIYTLLIFFFTYFWTAIQYNVEDISNNLKRGGSFIPGVRPGKQTKDFLDGVISRITVVGAGFITVIALLQYISPRLLGMQGTYFSVLGGTSLLILVSVALETMRQIEANILMKQYGT